MKPTTFSSWLTPILTIFVLMNWAFSPPAVCADTPSTQQSANIGAVTDGVYPIRPIQLIVPYSPGGTTDTAARLLASVTHSYLGQPVEVENRSGNGGQTGTDYVHKASADGYTLLLGRFGAITGPAAMKMELPYEYNDFTMLGLLEFNPGCCSTSLSSPYRTIQDVLDDIAEQPGQVRYGITGKGSLLHLLVLKMIDLAGIKNPSKAAVPVLYSGGGKMHQGLVRGEFEFFCSNLPVVLPYIRTQKLRPLMTIPRSGTHYCLMYPPEQSWASRIWSLLSDGAPCSVRRGCRAM